MISSPSLIPSNAPPSLLVDSHQHLWDPELFSYSWMKEFPAIRRRALLAEYREASQQLGITKTVFVETDVDEMDRKPESMKILALAEDSSSKIAGIVAGAPLEKPNPYSHLETVAARSKIKGIRKVLHTGPDEVFRNRYFVENVRELSSRRWSFDLCVLARQLPLARELAESCPDVSFILDHCGGPDIFGQVLHPWKEELRELSCLPNVTCKVSGLVTFATPASSIAQDLRPYFDHVVDCFGWARIMWGSDWPVCNLTSSLAAWLETASLLASGASPAEQRAFFGENAQRVYRLDSSPDASL